MHLSILFLRCSRSPGAGGTHKLNAAVVGEQLLDPDAPVASGYQSSAGLVGLTQEADPRVQSLQKAEGPVPHQDVQTVGTVRPAGLEGEEVHLGSRSPCTLCSPGTALWEALQVNLPSTTTHFRNGFTSIAINTRTVFNV